MGTVQMDMLRDCFTGQVAFGEGPGNRLKCSAIASRRAGPVLRIARRNEAVAARVVYESRARVCCMVGPSSRFQNDIPPEGMRSTESPLLMKNPPALTAVMDLKHFNRRWQMGRALP